MLKFSKKSITIIFLLIVIFLSILFSQNRSVSTLYYPKESLMTIEEAREQVLGKENDFSVRDSNPIVPYPTSIEKDNIDLFYNSSLNKNNASLDSSHGNVSSSTANCSSKNKSGYFNMSGEMCLSDEQLHMLQTRGGNQTNTGSQIGASDSGNTYVANNSDKSASFWSLLG